MKQESFASRSKASSPRIHWVVGALLFIGLAMAGALALSSCASTPQALEHERDFYQATTNAVALVGEVASNLPPPYGTVFKGVVVGCGILMAVWLTNLEKRLKGQINGSAKVDRAGKDGPA